MSDERPAFWRLAGASLVNIAPAYALVLLTIRPLLSTANAASAASRGSDAEQGPSSCAEAPTDPTRARASRKVQHGLLAYKWLEVALISALGRTPGMALFGLRLTRPDGSPIGTTRASVWIFGHGHLIRLITTPLRSSAPKMRSALLALVITNAAAALADAEHRTLWNRIARTRMVRA